LIKWFVIALTEIKITAQNYLVQTQTKHRKAKKRHGWTKLERITLDCIWMNLKNFGPTFSQGYLILCQKVIYAAGKSFSFVGVAVKNSCSANLTFRTHYRQNLKKSPGMRDLAPLAIHNSDDSIIASLHD